MSPTSTNRSPRLRPTDVGDSDLEAVEAHHTLMCFVGIAVPFCLRENEVFLS
ncbi:MAG: hypothetical protein K2H92_10590 [Bacteroidaceae bacterium]|nr:hypothetical protein [Bacteroidaceae bacterium]